MWYLQWFYIGHFEFRVLKKSRNGEKSLSPPPLDIIIGILEMHNQKIKKSAKARLHWKSTVATVGYKGNWTFPELLKKMNMYEM